MEEVIPLFLSIYVMEKDLQQIISDLIDEQLRLADLFIVDLKVIDKGGRTKLVLTLDGDKGVTLEQCAFVSRTIGEGIESQNLIEQAYNLEVGSSGIDEPLKMKRQYYSRVGRKLKVLLADGTEKEGKLETVTEEKITLLPDIKNKKKAKEADLEAIEIAFANIKQTYVLVSFN
ncbi:MAG: ribosome maturation factor RimP [Cytophagales bacterium]|nr:MAG: ribosome maturation factor RimP [Cytophagales bacterium]